MKNNNDQNQKKAANDFLSRIAAPGVLRGKTQKTEALETKPKEVLTEQAIVITKSHEENINPPQLDTTDLDSSSAKATKKKAPKNQIKKRTSSELKQLSTARIDTDLLSLLKLSQDLKQKSNHDILNTIGLEWLKINRKDLYQRVLAS